MLALEALLVDQAGVIARRQVMGLGLTSTEINRNLRRRHWALVHPGVYVDHTGPLTWHQRAWAGVLFSWPAALSHDSAVRAGDGPGRRVRDESTIHVAVDRHRSLVAPPGVRLHRMSGFGQRVRWNLGPPRILHEDAVLDVAADSGSDLDALGVLADACGSRRTTARRLLASLEERRRIARRDWLDSVLRDIAEGTCSVLEHGYLTRVERPHGLPRGRRQRPAVSTRGRVFRDVDYEKFGLIVELDGRAFHDSRARRWRGELPTADLPDAPIHDADVETGFAVRRALAAMSPEHREILVLRYYADLSERETADLLKLLAGTVKSRTARALKALSADQNIVRSA